MYTCRRRRTRPGVPTVYPLALSLCSTSGAHPLLAWLVASGSHRRRTCLDQCPSSTKSTPKSKTLPETLQRQPGTALRGGSSRQKMACASGRIFQSTCQSQCTPRASCTLSAKRVLLRSGHPSRKPSLLPFDERRSSGESTCQHTLGNEQENLKVQPFGGAVTKQISNVLAFQILQLVPLSQSSCSTHRCQSHPLHPTRSFHARALQSATL